MEIEAKKFSFPSLGLNNVEVGSKVRIPQHSFSPSLFEQTNIPCPSTQGEVRDYGAIVCIGAVNGERCLKVWY